MTPPEDQYTAPGPPHPGCAPTSPQALPVVPPLIGGENPQTLPRPPPEEHVMALHWGHHNVSPGHSLIINRPHPNIIPSSSLPARDSPRGGLTGP
jgi:hypothetical protein